MKSSDSGFLSLRVWNFSVGGFDAQVYECVVQ